MQLVMKWRTKMNNYFIFIYYLSSFLILLQLAVSVDSCCEELLYCINELDTTNLDKDYIEKLNKLKKQNYEIKVKSNKKIKRIIITNIITTVLITIMVIFLFIISSHIINFILLLQIGLLILKNIYSIKYFAILKKINT